MRAKGHVEPASVARDLPPLVAVIRKHGLEVPMVTTEIADADTPFTGGHSEDVRGARHTQLPFRRVQVGREQTLR